MLTRRSRSRLALAAALLLLLSFVSSALAGGPATVTVRAIGPNNQVLLPLTQVTTTTTTVVKDGTHSCSGTSAAGALELASTGNWTGTWSEGLGYFVNTIGGTALSGSYWNFWHNNQESQLGLCGVEPNTGDSLLLFPECFENCPASKPSVLSIEAPATAEANMPVPVTVLSYPNPSGAPVPAVGAVVVGGGDANAPATDAQGQTTMTFSGDGRYTLHASGSFEVPSIPAEAFICVHEGNDGTCGTTLPSGPSPVPTSLGSISPPTPKRPAVVAQVTGVSEGHVYAHGHGPRVLTGSVTAHDAVTSIAIELRRSYRGRCFAYNATRARFARARCGKGSFFKVANGGTSFSYLLPKKLPPGRYVLDLQATDAAGNHTALARGSSRIVFRVR